MKHVIIFHGTGGNPEQFWFPYIKNHLPKDEFSIQIPQLPNPDTPILSDWLDFAFAQYTYTEDTILIGHSAGCPLILSILENIPSPIHRAILVAGFSENIDAREKNPILQDTYNWGKIRNSAKHFVTINSKNDPWGCNDTVGRRIFENVGGDFIIRESEGHMGSISYNQPYREFPLLLSLIQL